MATVSSRRRIGVMGGTFDPIHVGHLIVAAEALHSLNLTEVIFVPAAMPWQKSPSESATNRLAMTRIAVASEPRFSVSDVDLVRGGNTYTVDTLADLATQHPDAELFLLLGTDALAGLASWKEPERIFGLAHVVCLARPGVLPPSRETLPGEVTFLTVPAIDISSSECRDRLRYGRPVRFMVTDAVCEYIQENNLYRRQS